MSAVVFSLVTSCSFLRVYQLFGGTYRFHLQSCPQPETWRRYVLLNLWLPHTRLHDIMQKGTYVPPRRKKTLYHNVCLLLSYFGRDFQYSLQSSIISVWITVFAASGRHDLPSRCLTARTMQEQGWNICVCTFASSVYFSMFLPTDCGQFALLETSKCVFIHFPLPELSYITNLLPQFYIIFCIPVPISIDPAAARLNSNLNVVKIISGSLIKNEHLRGWKWDIN
jgi:hypothetical protein